MKLSEIAEKLNLRVEGDGETGISGVNTLEEAGPTDLTFLSNPRYTPKVKTTAAAAVILSEKTPADGISIPILRAPDAYLAFARALELFYAAPTLPPGIHPTAVIDPTATIGTDARVGACVVIGPDVRIGDRATIHPNTTIYAGAVIGDDCLIHSNCVVREFVVIGNRVILQNNVTVGSDGFGFAKRPDKSWHKIPQSGDVHLEDDVEIGAGTTLDRGSLGTTRVGRGSKLDNLVQIGHGSRVGEDTLLCAQVGLAGSCEIGDRVILAGQVGVVGHLKVGDDVIVTAQSGVPNDVEPGRQVAGSPAYDHRQWLKVTAIQQRLPELVKTIRDLERRLARLEQAGNEDAAE